MEANIKNGFTIIELMLFLAVSGMLLAGLMIGSGVAISQQRYRDSVKSLQSVLQQQYSEVANVTNERPDNLICNSTGAISESASSPTPRGASDTCTIVGRFIQSHRPGSGVDSGEALHIQTILASGNVDPSFDGSDTEVLKRYNISTANDASRPPLIEKLEWDNKMRISGNNGPYGSQFSVLIIRSPQSGNIRTYAVPGPTSSNPKDMLDDYNLADLTICVETADGSLLPGDGMAIQLLKNSNNQSGVQTVSREAGNGC